MLRWSFLTTCLDHVIHVKFRPDISSNQKHFYKKNRRIWERILTFYRSLCRICPNVNYKLSDISQKSRTNHIYDHLNGHLTFMWTHHSVTLIIIDDDDDSYYMIHIVIDVPNPNYLASPQETLYISSNSLGGNKLITDGYHSGHEHEP